MHYGFSKRGSIDVNLHLYEEGHPEIELNLTFRNFLRIHHDLRDEYAAMKLKLLEDEASFEINNSIYSGYTLGKNDFIQKVLKMAGFQRLRFLKCTHYSEWQAVKRMRQRYFFDKVPILDPYEWTFDHPDHAHLVLYRGVETIGYAHIQLWPESRGAIRIIVVEELERNRGFGKQFLTWIESWLKSKGYLSIHTSSSSDAVDFYKQMGYTVMPFNDPDGHEKDPRDTPMGKLLSFPLQ